MSYVLLNRPDSFVPPPPIEAASATSRTTTRVEALIAALAGQEPDRLALSDTSRQLSYHDLNAQANQLARYIQRRGVRSETPIGVCMERSVEMVIACLAILKAGGAYVPLDPAYPTERIAFMMADSRMPILITKQALHAALDPHVPMAICIDADWPRIAEECDENLPASRSIDRLAYVIYTSGSTGQPKGVQIEQRGLLNLIAWHQRAFAITKDDRATQLAGPAFDATVWELWPYLTTGASIHIPDEQTRLDPARLRDYLLDQQITACFAPTPLAEHLIELEWPAEASLRTLLTGGDWLTRRPRASLPFALINCYGPTENSVVSTAGPVLPIATAEVPDIGHPIDNVRAYILDAQLQPVPVGEPGELCVAGVGLARGYLNRPELTAEKFVRDPFAQSPEERMYRTGDLVRLRPNGAIEFLGRIDHQVKIRGFRIELGEIDAVLKQHRAVRDAIVEAREFEQHGAREKRLIAFVAPVSRQLIASAELVADLRAFVRAKLPEYMVPPTFVMLEALPLTPNGKIDRAALPTPAADELLLTAADEPRTPTEAMLAALWARALGRPSVGIFDDFFALGGHSLLAAHVVALAGQAVGRALPVNMLYQAPTIAAFSQALQGEAQAAQVTPAELHADVQLDPAITPPAGAQAAIIRNPDAILLTGATGFLGAFLLGELLHKTSATIHCLVRAGSPSEGRRRILQTLAQYRIEVGGLGSRIAPLIGDLGEPNLGLDAATYQQIAETVDVIYHTGAQVHYLHPYSTLKSANVQGTTEVLRLACQSHLKPVHYVSTIAVAAACGRPGLLLEGEPLTTCQSTKGYDQSKWVAEGIIHLARERGIPVSIYRPGRIGAHSQTGAANADDFFMRLVAGCIQLGLVPDHAIRENLVPVDYAAESIVSLSQRPESHGQTYHLMNPQSTEWEVTVETAQRLGYTLQPVPYEEWRQAMIEVVEASPEHPLHGFLTFVPADPSLADWIGYLDRQQFDMANTTRELSHQARSCPEVTEAYLSRMIEDGVRRGIFPTARDQNASEVIALHPLTPVLA